MTSGEPAPSMEDIARCMEEISKVQGSPPGAPQSSGKFNVFIGCWLACCWLLAGWLAGLLAVGWLAGQKDS